MVLQRSIKKKDEIERLKQGDALKKSKKADDLSINTSDSTDLDVDMGGSMAARIFSKRRARKAEEERQRIAEQIGDNPSFSVSGEDKGKEDFDYYRSSSERDRQDMIYDDEYPQLTDDDKYDISRRIGQPEFDSRFAQPEGIFEEQGKTYYSLNPKFKAAADEKLKEKHQAKMIELGREKSMVDPNVIPIKNRIDYYSYKSPEKGYADDLYDWEMD